MHYCVGARDSPFRVMTRLSSDARRRDLLEIAILPIRVRHARGLLDPTRAPVRRARGHDGIRCRGTCEDLVLCHDRGFSRRVDGAVLLEPGAKSPVGPTAGVTGPHVRARQDGELTFALDRVRRASFSSVPEDEARQLVFDSWCRLHLTGHLRRRDGTQHADPQHGKSDERVTDEVLHVRDVPSGNAISGGAVPLTTSAHCASLAICRKLASTGADGWRTRPGLERRSSRTAGGRGTEPKSSSGRRTQDIGARRHLLRLPRAGLARTTVSVRFLLRDVCSNAFMIKGDRTSDDNVPEGSNGTVATNDVIDNLLDQVLREPWGTLSRARLDYLIFCTLVATGRIHVEQSDFDIANELQTTPARVRTLLYRFEQDAVRRDKALLNGLLTPQNIAFAEKVGVDKVRIQIRSKYLREHFIAKLIDRGAVTTREVTATTFTAPVDAFMDELVRVGVTAEGDQQEVEFSALFSRLTTLAHSTTIADGLASIEKDYKVSIVGNLVGLLGSLQARLQGLTAL